MTCNQMLQLSTNSLPLCISPWVVYCAYSILDCKYVYCVAFVCDWCDNVEIIGKNPHIVSKGHYGLFLANVLASTGLHKTHEWTTLGE